MQYIKLDLDKIYDINSFSDEVITKLNNDYYIEIDIEKLYELKYNILNEIIEFYSNDIILLTKLSLIRYHDEKYYKNLIQMLLKEYNISHNYDNIYFIYKP